MSQESELKNVAKSVVDVQCTHKGKIPAQIAERNYQAWQKMDIKEIACASMPKQAINHKVEVTYAKLQKLRSET